MFVHEGVLEGAVQRMVVMRRTAVAPVVKITF